MLEGSPEAIFVESARALGIDFVHFNGMTGSYLLPEVFAPGAALFDYDNDGDLDAFLIQGRLIEPGKVSTDALLAAPEGDLIDRLYRNQLVETGDLGFVDVTGVSGIVGDGYGMGVVAGDYDGDGAVDLYVTHLGSNRLWRNRGDGTFEDATERAGVDDPRWSVPAVFFDYDGDNDLDLYVGNYVDFNLGTHTVCSTEGGDPDYCGPKSFRPEPDRLLRNRGDGTFEDVTREAGLWRDYGTALGAVAADFNRDGRLDLYVANDWMPNQMWINQGGRFENQALLGGTALSIDGVAEASMGVDTGDYDNDLDDDLLLTHLTGETNTLYRNDGDARFVDVSLQSRLGPPSWSSTGFGTAWLDYDNDGLLDVLVVNGAIRRLESLDTVGHPYPLAQPNQLFHNLGSEGFEEVSARAGSGVTAAEVSRGAAFGDVDNDGDTDVLVANNSGPARLLLNRVGQDASWIGGRLVTAEGRDALGSRVRVHLRDGRVLERLVRTGASYASSLDPRVLVGLGAQTSVEAVEVVWADGAQESFGALETRRYHLLRRGEGSPVR